jgi:hypothetical protein
MYVKAELVVKSYMPKKLEPGMLFIKGHHVNTDREFMELWALDKVPFNSEEFMLENGAPVELAIIDEDEEILATHEEIGWITYDYEEFDELTITDINTIFNEYGGFIHILLEEDPEEEDEYIISMYEDCVIISFPEDLNDDDEDEDLDARQQRELEEIKRIEDDNK